MATTSTSELENVRLIWLDGTINEGDNGKTQDDLRLLSEQFHPFDNIENCISYIRSLSSDECIILITSGQLGREIVPDIHSYEQIDSIYVYWFDR